MTIFRDLNEIGLDLDEYEEEELSSYDKKKWEKRVQKKIRKQRQSRKGKIAWAAAATLLAAGVAISPSVANMPFVAGLIEEYLNSNEKLDYSAYKTAIGDTAENEFGKMTLNEVMIDGGRLIISSTFEPAEGIDFQYQMVPIPMVKMNGQSQTLSAGGESIEINDSMFSVYNEVEVHEIPIGETVHFHIQFDHLDYPDTPMDLPWIFDIEVPTEQLAAASKTIVFDDQIDLGNGQIIRLERLVATPISTILYYDWPEQAHHIAFNLVSETGEEIKPGTSSVTPEGSFNRYQAIDLQSGKYHLVPYELSENPHAIEPGKVPEIRIPITP